MADQRTVRFELNPSQMKLYTSTDHNILLCGGFGSGKSTVAAMKTLQLKAANPGVPGLLMSQTHKSLWAITIRTLYSVCQAYGIKKPVVVDKQGECYLDFGDHVPVFLRGAHSPASFDGLDVGWEVGDELRHWSKEAYDVAIGRRRVPCPLPQSVFVSTPEWHWMAAEFNAGKPDRPIIVSPTKENLHNLSPEFVENLKSSYSLPMQRAVLEGKFSVLEGAVFECFDPDPKTSPWMVDYDPKQTNGETTYLAIDPGYRRSAWMWIRESGPCEWTIFDQMMPAGMSDRDCVREINRRGWPVDEIWIDPAADATQSAMSLDTLDMLTGIKTRSRTPVRMITGRFRRIEYGIDKMRVLLGDPENHYTPIRIKIARSLAERESGRLRGIVRDLASVRYPETKDGRTVVDRYVKDGLAEHSVDALRYFCVGMWLTSGLRDLDVDLRYEDTPGYKVAA